MRGCPQGLAHGEGLATVVAACSNSLPIASFPFQCVDALKDLLMGKDWPRWLLPILTLSIAFFPFQCVDALKDLLMGKDWATVVAALPTIVTPKRRGGKRGGDAAAASAEGHKEPPTDGGCVPCPPFWSTVSLLWEVDRFDAQ